MTDKISTTDFPAFSFSETGVIPMISRGHLDAMVDVAITRPQELPSPSYRVWFGSGRTLWSGGLAAAACLLLLLNFIPQSAPKFQADSASDTLVQDVNELITADMIDNL